MRAVVDLRLPAQVDEVHAVAQALDARDALLPRPVVGDHHIVGLPCLCDLVGRIPDVDVLIRQLCPQGLVRRILHGTRGIAEDDHAVLTFGRVGVEPVDKGLEVYVDADNRDHDAVLVDGTEVRDDVAIQVRRVVRLRPSGLALVHQIGKGDHMARGRVTNFLLLLDQDIVECRVAAIGSLPERRDILGWIVEIVRADDVEIRTGILEVVIDRLCQMLPEGEVAQLRRIVDLP